MVTNKPKISVIVPVYNVEQYLFQCIDSILSQSFIDFELLLIDDGALDSSGKICDSYSKEDARVIVFHQKNQGVSAARNKGLNEARGEYVVFIDADDWVGATYLQDLYMALPNDASFRGLIIQGFQKVSLDGIFVDLPLPEVQISSFEMYRVLTEFIDKGVGYPFSKLYNLSLIRENEIFFSREISLLEDLFFLLDYILHADFVIINDIHNYYYRVAHSASALSVRKMNFDDEYKLFRMYKERISIYKQHYHLDEIQLHKPWRSLMSLFYRPVMSLYSSSYKGSKIASLRNLTKENRDLVECYFLSDYKIDRIFRYLLLHEYYYLSNIWMIFWLSVKSKHMYGLVK